MVSLFFAYSPQDEPLRDELEKHLAALKQQGILSTWHDRRLLPGADRSDSQKQLERAEIILLLVSADFLKSDFCTDGSLAAALSRHHSGAARVIPVILRPCDWLHTEFGMLTPLPSGGRPVTKWADQDEAFLDIIQAIRAALPSRPVMPASATARIPMPPPSTGAELLPLRSSNLRVPKIFTDRDQDRFLDETFEYLVLFFENSLRELQARHPDIETDFKRIDATRFSAAAYRHGKVQSRCRIGLGSFAFGSKGIQFSHGDAMNGINDSLTVITGEHSLYLRTMHSHRTGSGHLSRYGAAEHYWDLFMSRLQGGVR